MKQFNDSSKPPSKLLTELIAALAKCAQLSLKMTEYCTVADPTLCTTTGVWHVTRTFFYAEQGVVIKTMSNLVFPTL